MINKNISKKIEIKADTDVVKARTLIKEVSKKMGFNLVNQTKIAVAVSELTRNIRNYASEGIMRFEEIESEEYVGLKIIVEDQGPGIENIELAITDGFSTGRGLGKGLSGTKKLMDEFTIESTLGEGTKLEIIKWLKEG
jgi:serine/threonine-protein kinase RsbT